MQARNEDEPVSLRQMKLYCKRRPRPGDIAKLPKPLKPVTPKTLRRKLPDNVRRAIIVLIFGSDANFTKQEKTPTRVAKLLRISTKTVQSVVKYFRQQNSDLDNFVDRRTLKPHTLDKIDPRIRNEVLR